MLSVTELQELATQIRRDIVRMTNAAASGHPGGSLGCADFLSALFFNVLHIQPQPFYMDGVGEDLFFLSNGHITPVYYSVLARRGYFPVSELSTFRKIGSRLQGHPATKEGLPGVRIASGSLGQGLSVAAGAALSKKLNTDLRLVFSLHGDGELQEGQIWEAAMFAAHHKIDNLIATVDWNGQQIDGPTEKVMSLANLPDKWRAFGWEVLLMNGHNTHEILATLQYAKQRCGNGKPIVILMKTEMGKGVDFMEGTHKWHGVAPNNEQLAKALAQLPETKWGDY
ncbi:transketolase [Sphingobacteriales bacterium UPWRP_1]|nr:transketolase [Sphingobacteriales bacterium TSM_CSS]PSJ73930.1 transketolase [Sphingobacteriales bacterium UPWRP_1]